jgi:hypothetical protein
MTGERLSTDLRTDRADQDRAGDVDFYRVESRRAKGARALNLWRGWVGNRFSGNIETSRVVINNKIFTRIMTFPAEDNPILVIDADALKTFSVTLQGYQAVSRRGAQVEQGMRTGQHIQPAQGNRDDIRWKSPNPRRWAAMIEVGAAWVAKGDDHFSPNMDGSPYTLAVQACIS